MRTTETRTVLAHTERCEWAEARSIAEGWLAATNCGIFNRPDTPPTPPTTPFTPARNVADALHHARQKHATYLDVDAVHHSTNRSTYRRALTNLWNVLAYYEQENP